MSRVTFIHSPTQSLPTLREARPDLVTTWETVSASAHNEAIDIIRLFAAAGIVFTHAAESPAFDRWGNLFRFGVPFFLFASFYYQAKAMRAHPERTLFQLIGGRSKRLYIPFIVWSVIYLLVRDIKRIFILHESPVLPHLSMLWTGTEYHLWFLPFLMICSVVLACMQRGLFQHQPRLQWPAIGIAIGIGLAIARRANPAMPPVTDTTFDSPAYAYLQWWLAMPATCWGFAFAWLAAITPLVSAFTPTVGMAALLLAAGCSMKQALHGIEVAPRGLSGLGCMVAALSPWRGRPVAGLARLGRMSYGIYLCHVLPVEIIHVISHRCHLVPSTGLDVVTFVISLIASFGIVWSLGRSPKLVWLIAERRTPIIAVSAPTHSTQRFDAIRWASNSKSLAA